MGSHLPRRVGMRGRALELKLFVVLYTLHLSNTPFHFPYNNCTHTPNHSTLYHKRQTTHKHEFDLLNFKLILFHLGLDNSACVSFLPREQWTMTQSARVSRIMSPNQQGDEVGILCLLHSTYIFYTYIYVCTYEAPILPSAP